MKHSILRDESKPNSLLSDGRIFDDGTSEEYFFGDGDPDDPTSWAPIMGACKAVNVTALRQN